MRYTTKRNGKNVIPLLNAVCGINMPYWRIDRADDLHSYLSGDAADKLAAYEDAEEQGLLVRLPCKAGDTVYFIFRDKIYSGLILRVNLCKGFETQSVTIHVKYSVRGHVLFDAVEIGKTAFFTREEAEAALIGETKDV